LQKRVVAEISANVQEIISVGKAMVILVLDGHIPANKAHMKTKNCWILAVVRKNEF
jgi:hypothetical protein